MKELSIKEKAKAYDKALEKAKALYKAAEPMSGCNVLLETLFPEFKVKENEDEEVRKELVAFLKETIDNVGESPNIWTMANAKKWLAWLEKQKFTDKAEPKFKVGDWCIDNTDGTIFQIVRVLDNIYTYKTNDGKKYSCTHYSLENDAHLWTIQDAKPGDVLATSDHILIFKEFLKNDGGISYCHYDFGAGNPQFIWSEDKNWYFGKEAIVHPATKEQRDLLFQRMKEAGYEWEADEKKSEKIGRKFKVGDRIYLKPEHRMPNDDTPIVNTIHEIIAIDDKHYRFEGSFIFIEDQDKFELVKQMPAWSEEDKTYLDHIITAVKLYYTDDEGKENPWRDELLRWLKSIKERVQPQSKQKWSEEDKKMFVNIKACLRNANKDYSREVEWLKSIKPPYGLKQECVDCQFNYAGECKGSCAMKRDEQKPADKAEPKFKIGDTIWKKTDHSNRITILSIDEYFYYANSYNILIEIADKEWEPVEQKSADKIEPKFKVDDWIIFNGLTLYIKEVGKGFYRTISKGGTPNSYAWDIDNVARLWVIQDARPGDVLSDGTTIFIFKDLLSDGSVMSYCDYDTDSGESDAFCPLSVNLICSKITPATKEQRDTLKKAIADAGYTFDSEKKELKKIEINPAWDSEDESRMDNLCHFLEEYGNQYYGYLTLLSTISWVKSLRPQATWKPSGEQIMALRWVLNHIPYDSHKEEISGLLEQLKKLREK